MIARFQRPNGAEIRFVLGDLAPSSCGFSATPAIVTKPFSGAGLFRPNPEPDPACRGEKLPQSRAVERLLIEPFDRPARLIG
jgi:hypothetical protein